MKRPAIAITLLTMVLAGWARYQTSASSSESSLARLMPQGALLFIEGKDFGGLLHDWASSPEKQSWLKSDNYEVFSRSRLFLRLQAAQQEFAAAAGVPPNTKFLSEIAGTRTALGIFDIGKLEMLYITELPSAQATESGIWQQRSKFDPRESAGEQFFTRTDPQSGRTVAFAVNGSYLVLATREDLVAGALSAIKGAQVATVDREPWFAEAVKAAKQPGDLRMVIHLDEVTKTPHFRTYWIQQNTTAMRAYRSAISDLYRSAGEYREERILLRMDAEPGVGSDSDAAQLAQLIPPDAGFYSSQSAPAAGEVVAAIEQKILTPRSGPAPLSQLAPGVNLRQGTIGSETSLEERIDVPPAAPATVTNGDEALKDTINANPPTAMLKLHLTKLEPDGVFAKISSTVVLSAANSWDETQVRSAIQRIVAPLTTASALGAGWKNVGSGQRAHAEFDGLLPVAIAVRGKYLVVSNDPAMLDAVLARMQQKQSVVAPAAYIASFQHQKERQDFYRLAALVDLPNRNSAATVRSPEFFSDNLTSLSKSLAQSLAKESVEIRRSGTVETQTVRYEWSR